MYLDNDRSPASPLNHQSLSLKTHSNVLDCTKSFYEVLDRLKTSTKPLENRYNTKYCMTQSHWHHLIDPINPEARAIPPAPPPVLRASHPAARQRPYPLPRSFHLPQPRDSRASGTPFVNSEALRQGFEAMKSGGLSRTLPTFTPTSLLSSIFNTPLPSPHHTFTLLPSLITPSRHHHHHHQHRQQQQVSPGKYTHILGGGSNGNGTAR